MTLITKSLFLFIKLVYFILHFVLFGMKKYKFYICIQEIQLIDNILLIQLNLADHFMILINELKK